MWFSKPEFRHLISSYETSAQTHGGDGALYVRLSRSGGDGP
jgi:DNA-nicking Smr family endonuclease